MGKHLTKVTGFRIEDESILEKLNVIAQENCRTRNKEVEFALKQYVQNYEKQNGRITIGEINQSGSGNSINIG